MMKMRTYEITKYNIKKDYEFLSEEKKTLTDIKVYIVENHNDELTISAKSEFTHMGEKFESKFTSYKVKEDKKGKYISYNLNNMCTKIKIYL